MAQKRKATAPHTGGSPTKRHTRSSGHLTQLDDPPLRMPTRSSTRRFSGSTPATVPPVIRTYGRRRHIALLPASDRSSGSLKENSRWKAQSRTSESDSNDSEDQLILSPSKTHSSRPATYTKTGTPRLYMDAVEIVSPSKRMVKGSQQNNTGLPALKLQRRVLKAQGDDSDDPLSSSLPVETLITPPSAANSLSKKQNTVHLPAASASASRSKNTPVITPHTSPSRKIVTPHPSPSHLPRPLPAHLHSCFNAQKRAILCALRNPPDTSYDDHKDDEDKEGDNEPPTNDLAFQQLTDLLNGTVTRGEGNSCLLLGPRGSGKTRLVERCLSNLPDRPILLRLSGWAQQNDRLAMREIARQLTQQTGTSFLSTTDDPDSESDSIQENKEVNPFLDTPASTPLSLPPPSHLPALISVLPTLYRPTIVLLDAFDLFTLHARQSLLYCLLDTVQSCRLSARRKGVAVIGVTSRVDTVNLLEKRVKSRFSGRIVRTAAPRRLQNWLGIVRAILCVEVDKGEEMEELAEWKGVWKAAVGTFLADQVVADAVNETFGVTRDVRMLFRILTSSILGLSPSAPFLTSSLLVSTAAVQRSRPQFPFLHTIPYPAVCLLISSIHSQTIGHPFITFEMLHECFRDQVRASTSAPVQVNGGSIGMVRCTREVLMSAFEWLVSARMFVCVTAPSLSIAKEFVRYHCVVERDEVKKAVEKIGQTNLKKWLNRAQ